MLKVKRWRRNLRQQILRYVARMDRELTEELWTSVAASIGEVVSFAAVDEAGGWSSTTEGRRDRFR